MDNKVYTHQQYNALLDEVIGEIRKLSKLKGGEYAGDFDRLANFRRNAVGLHLSMEQIWGVYAAKHWDAINQYLRDIATGVTRPRMEPITEKAKDLIVYLILFLAIHDERQIRIIDHYATNAKEAERDVGSNLSGQEPNR